MSKFTRDVQTLVFSKKWWVRIPAGEDLTREILEECQRNLYLLDENELVAMTLPIDWELIAK